ncbi:hypothetical protein [Tenacibaculum maritimum]|uniref:hypothetical protein n=1 Tax=Tenacibaculum maritimum TaxID=107401 RepID=UPI0012E491C1|nr:hypothetical protein [Tenacibaculum maritimum]CAA0165208.1 conserved hypothetical protein [Tenacibaculum maritimum]
MGGTILKTASGNYIEKATKDITYYGRNINTMAGKGIYEKAEVITIGDAEEAPESLVFKKCKAKEPDAADPSIIGTCSYYKFRFENFMKRHENCKHDPPGYYYGVMRKIEGGLGIVDGINEWWTPSLEKEMGNEELQEYKREHGLFKAVPSKSYGYKYCIRFTYVLMPVLSEKGKLWLVRAKGNLQRYMEMGVVGKAFYSRKNKKFNIRYGLPKKKDQFYTKIEDRNNEFRDFAFATHPDAYLDAGLAGIPIADKIKVAMTPDFKEWGEGDTWEQAIIVMDEQINYWYEEAKNGVKAAQEEIENAVREAEEYLKIFKSAMDAWEWANQQLNKYRGMPWLR